MFAIEDQSVSTGNRWYVDSGSATNSDSAGSGQNPDKPFATLDYAIEITTANNGDIIYVMPGHTETIIAESGVDIDKAGLTIIGLGHGADRPTFTFTTAAGADFKLAAASTRIENLLFIAGIDALTGPIEVSAADCAIINCEYRDAGAYETTDVVVGTSAADRCLVDGFVFRQEGGQAGTQIQNVLTFLATDGNIIRNCLLISDSAMGGIEFGQATHLHIHHNYVESTNANDVCITLGSTSTGLVHDNYLKIVTDSELTWITATNDCALFENYGVNDDAQTGMIIGTAST